MNPKMKNLPRLRVHMIDKEGVHVTFREPKWIGEQWIACLIPTMGTFFWGRFSSINLGNHTAVFVLEKNENASLLKVGFEYEYLDGYWGKLAELVFDSARAWQKVEFVPRDAVRHNINGTTEDVQDGWDHEHCRICWEKISQIESEHKIGYKEQNNEWVCEQCYNSFVKQRNLDFVFEQKE